MPNSPNPRYIKSAKEKESMPKPVPPKKRQPSGRISAACEACKKRKTKCTGGPPPCQLCQSLSTECVIDLSLDMRRRAALQRTIDESKAHQESLSDLLDCLRDGSEDVVQTIIQSLRGGVEIQDLNLVVHDLSSRVREVENDRRGSTLLIPPSVLSEGGESSFRYPDNVAEPNHYEFDSQAITEEEDAHLSMKGKESSSSQSYATLLRYLRNQSVAEADHALRELVSVQDISDFISKERLQEEHERFNSNLNEIQSPRSQGLQEDRRHWHPALQNSVGTSPSSTTFTTIVKQSSNTSSKVGTPDYDSPTKQEVMTAIDSFSLSGSSQTPQASPTTYQRRSSGPISHHRKAQAPYVEADLTSLDTNAEDLWVAQDEPGYRLRIPIHLIRPMTMADDSMMGQIYARYLRAAREMLSSGTALSLLLGPDDDVVVDLLFRQRAQEDRWDCCGWASELLRGFTELEIFVRLACVFFLSRLMKWLIVPSIENYHDMPDMMKPTPMQRQIPHISPIDLIPIPAIRDAAIVKLRDWLTPLAGGRLTVNWPFTEQDAMERDPGTMSIRLTQRFLSHAERDENWSVDSSFLSTFPELAGRIRIHQ